MITELKSITLWMEGYSATCEHEPAQCLGIYQATDITDAVKQYSRQSRVKVDINRFGKDRHAVWAREIFDNEEQARKSFG